MENIKYNSDTAFLGHKTKRKILDTLDECFKTCDEFMLSVSFIKESGLNLLYDKICAALERGAKGRIITTDYLHFTDSESLHSLFKLMIKYKDPKKFSVYLVNIGKEEQNAYTTYHTKGYIFRKGTTASIIIGSSNLSRTALNSSGGEWSLYSRTLATDDLFAEAKNEFDFNANDIANLLTENLIKRYEKRIDLVIDEAATPNYMQVEALQKLSDTRSSGKNKALIIAAMASGKTFLSAFDALQFGAERILYIAQTETVLRKAQIDYRRVFRNSKTYGFYTGNEKDSTADIVFATIQTMHTHMGDFEADDFDYVIIDEAHHSRAPTYEKLIKHLKPKFLLGMTGTQYRTDRRDITELFGGQIPYELSLRDAIKYDLIMPFKYYSVSDEFIDYDKKVSDINIVEAMVNYDHGAYIDQEIKKHLSEINGKIKCLAFCVNVEHAKKMSELMKQFGYHCVDVNGETPIKERERVFEKLQDEKDDLQIVFSVNILNEGVDIPNVNMSLFLRPTESSIVFIQQLGRALRKAKNKLRPVIIDFIGKKYERSVYIAWALGSLVDAPVLTKSIIRNILLDESSMLGNIGVDLNFDDKSKKEIIDYLEDYNFNNQNVLAENYDQFKKYLNVTAFPRQSDFSSVAAGFDLVRILYKYGSYNLFLNKIGESNVPEFTDSQNAFLKYLSDFLPLTRPYEFAIFKVLIEKGPMKKNELINELKLIINDFNNDVFEHSVSVLLLNCESEANQKKMTRYLSIENNVYEFKPTLIKLNVNDMDEYIEMNLNDGMYRTFVIDLLEYGLLRFEEEHPTDSGNDFTLYNTYTRKEYTRIALQPKVYAFQPGVFYDNDGKRCSIFIDLVKKENVEEHLNYGDKFLTKNKFEWESQTETVIGNNRFNKLTSFKTIHIFVRKFQEEDGIILPYVYLGQGKLFNPRATKNTKQTVKFDVFLENALPDNLFNQFNIKEDA